VASPWPLRPCGIHHAQNAASPGGVLLTVGEIKEKKGEGKGRRRREEGVFRRNGTNIAHMYDAPRAHSSRA
jgi:hypothetical protein